MRVVSVLPSATEIVFALGHGSELVGRSAECDFPIAARELPVVMRPRTLDGDAPSQEIDARVREARGRNESLYTLDVPLLARLRPDLLLTQDLCGVCSVTEDEVWEACSRAGVAPAIVALTPRTLPEVWSSIESVGEALGDPRAGRELARRLRFRAPPRAGHDRDPSVLVVEWLDPPILAGLWTPEIVRAGGGRSLGPASGEPGERTSWERLRTLDPDLVIISPCSFSTSRTRRELEDPRLHRAIAGLSPPRGIFLADEAYFSRPGPRLADGADLVRNLLEGRTGGTPMPVEPWIESTGEAAA